MAILLHPHQKRHQELIEDDTRLYAELHGLTEALVLAALEDAARLSKDAGFRTLPSDTNLYAGLDALDALYKDISTINEGFRKELKVEFESNTDGDISRQAEVSQPFILTDCACIQINNAVQQYIDITQQAHTDILLNIDLRLQALGDRSGHSLNTYCMHPIALYKPFPHCLELLSISTQGKILLCELYHKVLACKLQTFYAKINELLLSANLLNSQQQLEAAAQARIHGIQPASDNVLEEPIDTMSTGEFFSPVDARSWGLIEAIRPAIYENSASFEHLAAVELLDIKSTSPLQKQYASVTQNTDIDYLLEPYAPGTGSLSTPYQRDQVIAALSHVQKANSDDDNLLSADQIQTRVKLFLYESGSIDANSIVENEKQVFDFANRIFDTIRQDDVLQDCIKRLLVKLQIPVIKLAVADFSFFKNSLHPARVLLNRLTFTSISVSNTSDALYLRLKKIVTIILKEFETDSSIFELALQQINLIDAYHNEQSLRVEVKTRNNATIKSRRSAARRKVIKLINHYLKGKSIPAEILDFCLQCWAPHMGLIYLYHGAKSEAWGIAVKSLRRLIEVTQPGRSLVSIEHITGGADEFFIIIREQLDQISDLERTKRSVFNHAERWYLKLIIRLTLSINPEKLARDQREPTIEGKTASIPSETAMQFIATIEDADKTLNANNDTYDLLPAIPPEVIPGVWFEIYRGEGRAKRRLKLSAILEDTGRLLFSDRSGMAVMEMDIRIFLNDLSNKHTQLIDEGNRFDNALGLVISSIRESQHKLASTYI